MLGIVSRVALRKESVDRNGQSTRNILTLTAVALRKESVDRNLSFAAAVGSLMSLSARRAWIEIYNYIIRHYWRIVALRKESVDRNNGVVATKEYNPWSLSARRAWIEISMSCNAGKL